MVSRTDKIEIPRGTELSSGFSQTAEEGSFDPQRRCGYAVAASILGWTLDSFDFFVLVFMVDILATHFAVGKSAIILTLGATLATRPLGALLFGTLADRYGRRKPLMAVVAYFSLIELLSGIAFNYPMFFVLRALYGIGMGGYWGVGASLAMETAPSRRRGLFSGMLTAGYPLGYLLAAMAARVLLPTWGWRAMFWSGLIPAAITLYAANKAHEPEPWKQHHVVNVRGLFRGVWEHRKTFAYLVLLLTLMVCLSHGTQDLYPDFLKTAHNFIPNVIAYVAMIYNVGGIVGGVAGGYTSERLGRRRSIIAALTLCLLVIPVWAFGHSHAMLVAASFLMQMGVQAAWGVMPAHLNELSPDVVRSLFSGFAYQLSVFLASPTNSIEYVLRDRFGYGGALTIFESATIVGLLIVLALGPENKGRSFLRER